MEHKNKAGYFDRLREKPIEYRRAFAIISSLAITMILAIIWLISSIVGTRIEPTNMSASASSSLSIFSVIRSQFDTVMGRNPFSGNTNTNNGAIQASPNQANLVQ